MISPILVVLSKLEKSISSLTNFALNTWMAGTIWHVLKQQNHKANNCNEIELTTVRRKAKA